jgi:hypothetical protein
MERVLRWLEDLDDTQSLSASDIPARVEEEVAMERPGVNFRATVLKAAVKQAGLDGFVMTGQVARRTRFRYRLPEGIVIEGPLAQEPSVKITKDGNVAVFTIQTTTNYEHKYL